MSIRPATVVILILVLGLLLPNGAQAEFDVPEGFADEPVVADVPNPTALAWLPANEGNDLLVTSQGGGIYRFDGTPPADQILDLSGTICSGGETGLLGIAVHPEFASGKRFIYVYYTDRKNDGNPCGEGNRVNRVSRFTMNAQDALVNEQVLIDNIPAPGGNHNGGDLQFDRDGLLYVSVGDGGQDLRTGELQDDNGNARRLDLLNGKILRVTPEGGIPAGNPFQGQGTARCAATGGLVRETGAVSPEKKSNKQKRKARKRKKRRNQRPATVCREIFATGLRNPFRIAFDPNDASGAQRFFINDVGGDGFEEVNRGQAGADYGWNIREGFCPIDRIADNCSGSNRFVDPVFAYRTGGSAPPFQGCRTITGGAFVSGGDWPGDYLFADFGCDTLFALTLSGSGATVAEFATGESATHLAYGPDGNLYYTAFRDGEVRMIVDQ